ncbi:MAG: hypothetical protein GX092_04135 [Clostridia bacterium]|jgi:hypothetical protein|nr:hypothetical protein [Clostridia bacterium]
MKLNAMYNFKHKHNLKSIKWKWIILAFLLIVILYGGVYFFEELTKLPPQEAIKQSLFNTMHAQNYRFEVKATRIYEGKETLLSDLHGEKGAQGIYLKGTIPLIKADVEIYHLGTTLYRRDPFTKGWVVVPTEGRVGIEQLITELNPLGVFNFPEENLDVKYVGVERVQGKKCRVYEIMTRGENRYLQLFWQDFNYIIWIDRKEGLIRQAQISAEHRDDSQYNLKLLVSFYDFNKEIELKPPIPTE